MMLEEKISNEFQRYFLSDKAEKMTTWSEYQDILKDWLKSIMV